MAKCGLIATSLGFVAPVHFWNLAPGAPVLANTVPIFSVTNTPNRSSVVGLLPVLVGWTLAIRALLTQAADRNELRKE